MKKVYLIISLVILMLGALIMLLPFVWMVSTSFKEPGTEFAYPPEFIPRKFILDNYIDTWKRVPFGLFIMNSFKISILIVLGRVICASLAAYAFAKLDFPMKNIIFSLVLATMMIPFAVTMIPMYLLMKKIGWINNHLALIVPGSLFHAYSIFFLTQFFKTIPKDFEDAARIDGSNTLGILLRIVLPLSKPAITTISVLSFMWSWNDFLGPIIFLNSQDKYTVQIGVALFQGIEVTNWTRLMAASCISVIPVLVIFFLAQRYFVRSIVMTGLKG